jgi:hypothetical protein
MSKVLKGAEVVKVNNPIGLEFVKSSENFSDFQESSGTYLITYVAQDLQNPYKGLKPTGQVHGPLRKNAQPR